MVQSEAFAIAKQAIDLRDVVGDSQPVKRAGPNIQILCPFHQESTPSLTVYKDHYYCFGCQEKGDIFTWLQKTRGLNVVESLKEAARLAGIDLTVIETSSSRPLETPSGARITLTEYAAAKKLPLEFLRTVGVTERKSGGLPLLRMAYRNREGEEVAYNRRISMDGNDRFRFKNGVHKLLYGLWRLDAATPATLVLVEGESDAQTLWLNGIPALGVPGASCWNEARDAAHFDGVDTIFCVKEPDQGGNTLLAKLAQSRIADRIHVVDLGEYKDVSDLYVAEPDSFLASWKHAVASAIPLRQSMERNAEDNGQRQYEVAREFLEDSAPLDRVAAMMRTQGYVGDSQPALLAYVAMTSRVLRRPINLAFVAPSASGKNRAIDAAAALMPPEAMHRVSASSPMALVYSEENFQHRVVVMAEADSLADKGPAASAIRSIADDNYMRYDVVERSSSGRNVTRSIEKPGPTALLTTSTRSVARQLGTRVLEIHLRDDDTQTRNILHTLAQEARMEKIPSVPITPYVAAQRYIGLTAPTWVLVPFATILADLVLATHVRMRRDFRKLLSCIEAVAVLHQAHRERSVEGAVVATVEDYKMARSLLAPVFDAIAEEGLTPAIRETVHIVGTLLEEEGRYWVSQSQIAARLELSKSTVSWRVERAISGGWLDYVDEHKRARGGITRGDPLPDRQTSLPSHEQLQVLWEVEQAIENGDAAVAGDRS